MDFVDELKSRVDIVDVVGQFVRLKKSGVGARWVGLCPFHNEKTPSFSVHSQHQFYKCFGCGVGGDVIKFVMELERLSFYEALEYFSERYNIPLPKKQHSLADDETRVRAALYRMHELAQSLFRRNLDSNIGDAARLYLEKRQLTIEQIEEFGIGCSAPAWDQLLTLLRREGFSDAELEASGLVVKRESGGFYDRFRNRLMFPLHGESGKIIGFAGRALTPEDNPKYLNSPETPIYRKRGVLYNLHRAKEAMRKTERTVLVEGYMDVIGVVAAGVKEVVASCGTSLTEQQARLMKRYAGSVVVNFDPDSAGSNAAERSIEVFLTEDLSVRVLSLEGGLDPDDYVKQRGSEDYRQRIEEARPYFYWLADQARRRYDMLTGEGKASALKFLLPSLARVSNRLERMTLAMDLGGHLGIPSTLILKEFGANAERRREPGEPERNELPRVSRGERILLHWMLEGEQARDCLIAELEEAPYLERLQIRGLLEVFFQLHATQAEVRYRDVEARLDDPNRQLLSRLVMDEELGKEDFTLERARQLLQVFDSRYRQARLSELRLQVKEAERNRDVPKVMELMGEIQRLQAENGRREH